MVDLSQKDIKYLPGVGPVRADILAKEIGVSSYEDLLTYFPYKYVDRSRFYRVDEIQESMPHIQLIGRFVHFSTVEQGRNKRYSARFTDGTGFIDLVWFKGYKYLAGKFSTTTEYVVFGKPLAYKGGFSIAHPEVAPVSESVSKGAIAMQAQYTVTERMKNQFISSKVISKLIRLVLESSMPLLRETLSRDIIAKARLMPYDKAVEQIHFPETTDSLKAAQYRLKFEELFYIQLKILQYATTKRNHTKGVLFTKVGDHFHNFYKHHLPFSLTEAQKRVVREIHHDARSGKQMNRLLQGDVGSGKTIVALLSMMLAIDNDFQAALMAPTEILAQQHYQTISALLTPMGIRVSLLTGSTKAAQRRDTHNDLIDGSIHILIGTHALIEDSVQWQRLGLVIIDEQHRFGVVQRARLWSKSEQPPHVLVMTATPIPRTLAMTLYGDLDVSVIDELPPGRKPIETTHIYDNRTQSLHQSISKQLAQGRQIYVVYPLIQESEKSDYKNLETGYLLMQSAFSNHKVAMVHGKMKPKEKEENMQLFISGEARILVATTVIEVGVNVPNASVMVIESAERFGLSQLHQLRGRVGRGADQSYCILVTSHKLSEESRKRIEIMVETTDGFEIAEADLRMRGPGDLVGTQQSGVPFSLKVADLARDGAILQYARDRVEALLEQDPTLENEDHPILLRELKARSHNLQDWGRIS